MAHIPDGQEVKRTKKEIQALAIQLDEINKKAIKERKEKELLAETVQRLEEELKARGTAIRESRQKDFPIEETIPHELPEAETRKLYI
jgi:anaerobic glycerol-3-phosphate dehydrogenase